MSPRILIIDDDPSIREVVADVLEDEGYRVETAENGAAGLALIDQALPALVLLDMRMPVLDGWGFTHTLQARGIHLPIVVMTAAQDAHKWGQEVGAVEVVAKPFNLVELLDAVQRVIQTLE